MLDDGYVGALYIFFCLRRLIQKMSKDTSAITIMPPSAPPTMAVLGTFERL